MRNFFIQMYKNLSSYVKLSYSFEHHITANYLWKEKRLITSYWSTWIWLSCSERELWSLASTCHTGSMWQNNYPASIKPLIVSAALSCSQSRPAGDKLKTISLWNIRPLCKTGGNHRGCVLSCALMTADMCHWLYDLLVSCHCWI